MTDLLVDVTPGRGLGRVDFDSRGGNIVQPEGWTMKGSAAWRIRRDSPAADVDRTPRVWFQATKEF